MFLCRSFCPSPPKILQQYLIVAPGWDGKQDTVNPQPQPCQACRALYLREAEASPDLVQSEGRSALASVARKQDPELEGNVRSHWMDMAVQLDITGIGRTKGLPACLPRHYLEEASATSEDPALQRRLRAWRREERRATERQHVQ